MNQANPQKNKQLRSLDFRLKLTEVSLVSLCLGLGLDAFANGAVPQWPGVGMCCILTGAYVIITSVTIGCSIFAQPLPRNVGVAFSLVGGVLLTVMAVAVLRVWRYSSTSPPPAAASCVAGRANWLTGLQQMRLLGILAVLAAATFIADAAHIAVVGPWLKDEQEVAMSAAAAVAAAAAAATASLQDSTHERDADTDVDALNVPSSAPAFRPRALYSARLPLSTSPRPNSEISGGFSRRPQQSARSYRSLTSRLSAGESLRSRRPTSFTSNNNSSRQTGAHDRVTRPSTSSGLPLNWQSKYMGPPLIDERGFRNYRQEIY